MEKKGFTQHHFSTKNGAGFTIVELLIVVAVMALLTAALSPLFRTSYQAWRVGDRRAEVIQNARLGMDKISRELKQAKKITGVSADSVSQGYITFLDYDENAKAFRYDGGYLAYDSGSGLSTLAGPIESLYFSCYESDGTTLTTSLANISTIVAQMVTSDEEGEVGSLTSTDRIYLRKRKGWVQIDWSGGKTTPTLLNGTWEANYSFYYEDDDQANNQGSLEIAKKERYYIEDEEESTTTSTTWQDKALLTFTPRKQKDFLIIASGLVANSSISSQTEVRLRIDGSDYAINHFRPSGSASTDYNYYSFGAHKVISLDDTSHDIRVQYRSESSSGTAKIEKVRIIALEVSGYKSAISEGESSTKSTSWQDKVSLTFTPESAGDYLILATADLSGSSTSDSFFACLTFDSSSLGEMVREPTATNHYYTFAMVKKLNLSASSHTFIIQYKSEKATKSAYIKNARIIALRLTDLAEPITNIEYNESEGETSTTSGSYQDKVTLSFTPTQEGDYLIVASCLVRQGNTSWALYTRLLIDGVDYGAMKYRPKDGTDDYVPFSIVKRVSLTASSHTMKLQYQRYGGGTVYIKKARLIAIPLSARYSSCEITSSVYDTGASGTEYDIMDWDEELWDQSITFKVRTDTNSNMSGALDWGACDTVTKGWDISSLNSVNDGDQYIQYKPTLTTTDSLISPTLYEVAIELE